MYIEEQYVYQFIGCTKLIPKICLTKIELVHLMVLLEDYNDSFKVSKTTIMQKKKAKSYHKGSCGLRYHLKLLGCRENHPYQQVPHLKTVQQFDQVKRAKF